MSIRFPAIVLAFLLMTHASGAAAPPDRDGDGILDEHEEILGTDPAQPDSLRVVIDDGPEPEERRKQKTYDATKDFLKIEFGHVASDRHLWRATFAAPPRLKDTVFHLYVDADTNSETGRKGPPGGSFTGTDYMITIAGGRGYCGHYDAEGTRTAGPPVTHVVHGNTLLVSMDADIGRDDKGLRYALYVLCHTTTKSGQRASMSDSNGKRLISGLPISTRKKIVRPCDYATNFQVAATFGARLLRRVLRAKDTVVVRHDQLELDGFEIDQFTSRRWPHLKLRRRTAIAAAKAPKAGRYHVGFMMYDRHGRTDRVCIRIDGKRCGVAVANEDNNRTWLYWLEGARDFKGGERVELRGVGGASGHGIINLLFLPRPPEIRTVRYAVAHMAAVTPADNPRRVILSWTTTWPCPTKFEYGTDAKYGTKVEAENRCLVHRVVLDGLDPKAEHHGRAIGTTRDGKPFTGADFAFRAAPPKPEVPFGSINAVPLTVVNPHPFAVEGWPVTTGIPFPKGDLASLDHVRVMSGRDEVPAQVRLAARWPDGSIKWLLVTFAVGAKAAGSSQYRLEFSHLVQRRASQAKPMAALGAKGITVQAGGVSFRIDRSGEVTDVRWAGGNFGRPDAACRTVAVDAKGAFWSTSDGEAKLVIEENGPVRAVVKAVSHLAGKKGEKLLRIEKRIEAYRGAPFVRIHHTFVVMGSATFTELKELSYRIPARLRGGPLRVPVMRGDAEALDELAHTVRQRFDSEYVTVLAREETPKKGRLAGYILRDGQGGFAVAVRDFWQNYPKGFSFRLDGLHVDLCPAFQPGLYDKFPFEKEGHHLYYYLLNGRYKLKRGVAKTHELLLCFEPDPKKRKQLCAVFQRPLLATAPPEWYCGSRAFYDVAPRDTKRFPLYEEAIDKNLKAYAARQERQHDFGMLNYGDWYGERGSNWGNIEYDTQHAFFLEFIRSANPDALFLGHATELHHRDIDTVQWSADPNQLGAVYVHQMCHVGGYYTKSVPGTLGFPRGGFTVSHAWTEGHFEHYFLTGDRRSYETGCAVADFFIRKQLGRPYDFLTTRTPGWHLIMLAATYAATNDPYYLNAMRVVVERVLETQEVEPRPLPANQREGRKPFQIGGWSRMMRPGHCRCEPRHRGNAGFMVAVLLSGLKYYHDVTEDPRVKECIIRGAHYLLDECYSDETKGFRYTSCPKTRYGSGTSPLMVEGIARAHLWTKDKRLRRCLVESLPRRARGSAYGKGFSMYYRMAPRLLADLAKAGITLEKPDVKKR